MQEAKIKYRNGISQLGFGCMRLSKKGKEIDFEEAEKEVLYAIKHGVNYFDTAYVYEGVEETIGKILEKNNLRDKVNITSKLPCFKIKKVGDADAIFEESCGRLRTKRIDFYLLHMLPDVNVVEHMKRCGVFEYLEKMKIEGRIGHIGFSYHGNSENFIEILNEYNWEFCQFQFNYLDEVAGPTIKSLKAAHEKGILVIAMQPLRFGKLTHGLASDAVDVLKEANVDYTPAEWGLRWVWNHPEVTVLLSGMNSMDQVKENVRIASLAEPNQLTELELAVYDKVNDVINATNKVSCNGCSACMPCPHGVDIVGCFRHYNDSYREGFKSGFMSYMLWDAYKTKEKRASASMCTGCGECEKKCPKSIEIRKELKNVKKRFHNPIYYIVVPFLNSLYKYKK